MSSCLGLYIENNIIKYAKVNKEHDNIKIDAYGVKFYDNIEEAIKQIVEETYSYKIPISINLSDEMYQYYSMFALLSKNDLQKAIKTEFDSYCADKGYNPNVFETKYAIVNDIDSKDKLKVIYIYSNKIEINKRKQLLQNYQLKNISPLSMSIPNLLKVENNEKFLIVNIEDKTTVTTVLDKKIYDVNIVEEGSADVLSKINLKENSYAKAYEICKNTTIYTSEGKELQEENLEPLEDILPTLYNIVGQVKKILNSQLNKIEKVYITGTLALVNNIDLYFQEYLEDVKCEILRPEFINQTREINIKDYIEVNSAVSIALMGLGEGITGMNFKQETFMDKIPNWLKIDINPEKTKTEKKYLGGWLTFDLNQKLDKTEKGLLRTAGGLLILIIIYSAFSILLNNQFISKEEEADLSIANTNAQIQKVKNDETQVISLISDYEELIKSIEEAEQETNDINSTKMIIPNLLNQLMSAVPQNVQITSIQNTSGRKIEIYAQSNIYDPLGFLVAKIRNDRILTDVISSTGEKNNDIITIKIEGEMP